MINTNNMIKKILLLNWAFNLCEYTAVYLIATFIRWKFVNPFQWLIDLPTYEPGHRGEILFAVVCWQGIQLGIIYAVLTDNQKKKANAN